MGRKKELFAYKEGMKNGAKPFEKKFEEIQNQEEEISRISNDIKRNQTRLRELTDKLITEEEKNSENVADLKKETEDITKKIETEQKELDRVKNAISNYRDRCNVCGNIVKRSQIVCEVCGEITDNLPYDLQKFGFEHKQIEELNKLSNVIKSCKKDTSWLYPELEDKLFKIKKIQETAQERIKQKDNYAGVYKKVYKLTNEFMQKCNDEKLEIAVVGTVKAGKSSLINALIGKELASVNATPETSVLVKYRTTKTENYMKITYYTADEWNRLWASASKVNNFVNEYNATNAEKIKYDYLGKKKGTNLLQI